MELWDVYDINGKKSGKILNRDNEYTKEGEFHLASIICIVNENGKLLIQKRSDNKKSDPCKWSFTGGAVVSGETSVSGAIREIYEELNIIIQPSELIKIGTYIEKNAIFDAFITFISDKNSEIKIQKEEVSEYKWVDINILNKCLLNGEIAHNAVKAITLSVNYLSTKQRPED